MKGAPDGKEYGGRTSQKNRTYVDNTNSIRRGWGKIYQKGRECGLGGKEIGPSYPWVCISGPGGWQKRSLGVGVWRGERRNGTGGAPDGLRMTRHGTVVPMGERGREEREEAEGR